MTKAKYDIMVPIDGSANAKLAFKRAVLIAKHHSAGLYLVHIINLFTNTASADAEFLSTYAKIDKKHLKKYQIAAKEAGVNTKLGLYYGSPKVLLARKIPKKQHIHLIVMGANGLTKIERVLMGSVAVYVSREAPCNVLLVKDKKSKGLLPD